MITLHELETRFQHVPTHLFEIVVELRNIVKEIAPEAHEDIRSEGLVYYYAERGGPVSAGICQILIQPDHIRLAFNHGVNLPDPARLLEGDRLVKRFARIPSFDQACWEDIKALIEASSRFDPYSQTFRSR